MNFGNYGLQRYNVSLSLPAINNKLFVGLGGQLSKRGAVYENPTLNDKNFDGRRSINGFLNLKYLLTDSWVLGLTVRSEDNKDAGSFPWVAFRDVAFNEPYKAFGNFPNTEKISNTNAAFTAQYFGQKINFISQTSAIQYNGSYPDRFDFDFTEARFLVGTILQIRNSLLRNSEYLQLQQPKNCDGQ